MTGSVLHSASAPVLSFFLVLLALLGLSFGSFASVLVARIPERKNLWTRSQCGECGHVIAAKENIPLISFFILKGRCAHCSSKISSSYPLLEVGMALLFLSSIFIFSNWTPALLWLTLAAFGIPLVIIDITLHRLPDALTTSLLAISSLIIIGDAIIDSRYSRLLPSLIGGIGLCAFYLALAIISRGGMGMGDVKLAAALGVIAGYFGARTILISTFSAFILGSIIGIALMLVGKAGRKTVIPFGPFMIVGEAISLIVAAKNGL
jgi:leader peptidase (prepilin peptidase)/N-methyltransferase